MYDIKPLENEWKLYKKNKRKPYIYSGALVVLVSIGSIFFYNGEMVNFSKFSTYSNSIVISSAKEEKNSILINDAIFSIQVRPKDVMEVVKPVLMVNIKKIQRENIPTLSIVNEIPVLEEKPKRTVERKKTKVRKKIKPMEVKARKKMHLDIIESSSVSAYKDVEKRFYESHDTDDSLFLAKSYFRKGNYKKSEYWALQTNKVNANIEESWLIFAKSKVKYGRKNEAISILRNYVKRSNSNLAKNLLYKLMKN